MFLFNFTRFKGEGTFFAPIAPSRRMCAGIVSSRGLFLFLLNFTRFKGEGAFFAPIAPSRRMSARTVPSRGLFLFLQTWCYGSVILVARRVSVPSRGLFLFLQDLSFTTTSYIPCFSPLTGIVLISTCDTTYTGPDGIKFQSPRGDCSYFYLPIIASILILAILSFSPLAGIVLISTGDDDEHSR